MKRLFLSSYFSGVAALLPEFAGKSCDGLHCVFIPTASIVEKVTFFVGADKKALEKLHIKIDELEISTAPKEVIEKKVADADILFVEGGNTFFLLQELKRTGTDNLIIEHINKGKLYIGASAGSMIVSKDIEYVKYMDNPDAAKDLHNDFSALSVVDFCVVPHCTNFPFKKSAEKIISAYSDSLDLRPIHNAQVVIVDGNTVKTRTFEKNKK
jgi:dipeptidase E